MVDIVSDAVQTTEGVNYITANSSVTFNFHSPTGLDIPPDTVYTWHVIETSSSEGVNDTTVGTSLNHAFTDWGRYLVSVMGRTALGATFVGQLDVTVECKSICSYDFGRH